MLPRDVARQRDILNGLFKKIGALGNDDLELRSHWAKYLCVLIEGHLEVAVTAIYREYATSRVGIQPVRNFVEASLRRTAQTPNMQRILDLTSRFSPEWSEKLQVTTDGSLKDAVDSVARLRNKIAHGQSVGLTYIQVKDYYERICQVIDLLAAQCAN